MSTGYKTVLALSTAVLLLFVVPCSAEEQQSKADEPLERMELTEEKIDRLMDWLGDKSPEKAEKLEQLREENPEKFQAEVREIFQRQFGPRMRRPREQTGRAEQRGGGFGARAPGMGAGGFGGRGPHRRPEPGQESTRGVDRVFREHMEQRYREFTGWLEENYPEEAKELAELRERNPELYIARLRAIFRQYKGIWEEENTKVVEVLKEDVELKKQRDELMESIKATTDNKEKEELTGRLEEVVSRRFDLIIKRKQLRYEQLRNQLEELKIRVKKSEEKLAELKDSKREEVKQRLKELLEEAERIRWD